MHKFETQKQEHFTYFVDEEARTVVAVMDVPRDILSKEMLNVVRKSTGHLFLMDGVMIAKSLLISGTYRGIAHCHPNDVFDIKEGKDIAKRRALLQYYKERKVVSDRLATAFTDVARRMVLAADHNDYSIARITKQVNSAE